ncbi:phage head completion protein [Nafulsella turpanensis]|uniref:phage head completion protein n=1 Tax=Nafulsella turpanensis TaxID=1265690 RepID=UPI00034A8D75|nr:head-tail adaptor protein [Nafulsella turpanensis]
MLAYKLKYKIEVWEKVKTKNSIGSTTESEVLVAAVSADVQTTMGKVATNDDRVLFTTESTFIIRNYPLVTYNHFIRFNGDDYRILGIQPLPDGTGQIIKGVRNE